MFCASLGLTSEAVHSEGLVALLLRQGDIGPLALLWASPGDTTGPLARLFTSGSWLRWYGDPGGPLVLLVKRERGHGSTFPCVKILEHWTNLKSWSLNHYCNAVLPTACMYSTCADGPTEMASLAASWRRRRRPRWPPPGPPGPPAPSPCQHRRLPSRGWRQSGSCPPQDTRPPASSGTGGRGTLSGSPAASPPGKFQGAQSRSRFLRRFRSHLTRSLSKERVRSDLRRLKNRLQKPVLKTLFRPDLTRPLLYELPKPKTP